MRTVWSALVAIVCAIGLSARAEEAPVGFVKTLSGTVTINHSGVDAAVAPAMPVYEKDRLETGSDGECGITFRDNTRISLGPNSRIELKRFVFKPATEQYGLLLSLAYGTLEYISGVIEKLAPEAISIETPGFTVGARGTRLLVRAEQQQ
jgi:hypothetical protein